ncbi:hypothetical protein [Yersinia alsatica]|uniref:hypothetical protein n=1 Tax=Yersinia alsatica TaxID=2890317 RepID=UPI0011A158E7
MSVNPRWIYHQSEHWIIVSGTAMVTIGTNTKSLVANGGNFSWARPYYSVTELAIRKLPPLATGSQSLDIFNVKLSHQFIKRQVILKNYL